MKALIQRVLPLLLAASLCAQPLVSQQLAVNPAPLALSGELQKRMDAAAYAQQTGSPEDVAKASRRVISLALAQLAETRSIENALPASVALYRQSLEFEDTPAAHFWLALTYNLAGHTDEALRETAAVLAADPKDASAWNLQGKLQMQKQQYREAAASLEHSLALHTDMEVAYTMGTALLQAKDREKAAAVFKQMNDIAGNSGEMHIMIARAYDSAGIPDEAEKEYKAAIAADAKGSHGHYFLALFYLTRNQWESTPQIVDEFKQEVALNPKGFFGNYFLGYLASTEKNYDLSDQYLKVAAAAKPDWPEPPLYMGLNAYGRGDEAQAEQLLRKAITLTGADEARNDYQIRRAFFALGRILLRKGQKEEGTRDVERSREMETHLVVKARQQQALDIRQSGVLPSLASNVPTTAAKAVPLDLTIDPSTPIDASALTSTQLTSDERSKLLTSEKQLRLILGNAFNDLGTSLARQRDFAAAFQQFKNAERWNPSTENLQRNLGMAAYLSANYTEAARSLKLAVAQHPDDLRAQALLGVSLANTSDFAGAAAAFDNSGNAAFSDPEIAYRYALSLVKIKDPARAQNVLKQMSRLQVPPETLVKACKLYSDMGDNFNAQACNARAKSLGASESSPR